jgi:hypothetical protein
VWTDFPQRNKIKDKSESYKYDILKIEDFWVFNIKNWRLEEYHSSKINGKSPFLGHMMKTMFPLFFRFSLS